MSKLIYVDDYISLRQLELKDYIDIFNVINCQRTYLGEWLPFVAYTKEPDDSKKFVEYTMNLPKDKYEYVFTIRYQDQFIGLLGFKDTDHANKKSEIGYWISKEFQGNGIVSKSVSSLCAFAFAELDIHRIQIKCAVKNEKSKAIPRRLGFKLEGIERAGELFENNRFRDLEVYSLLREDQKK